MLKLINKHELDGETYQLDPGSTGCMGDGAIVIGLSLVMMWHQMHAVGAGRRKPTGEGVTGTTFLNG